MEFENENTKYKIFVAILLFFLMIFGLFVGITISYNSTVSNDLSSYTPDDMENDVNNAFDVSEKEAAAEEVVAKRYDIELVYIDNYALCGESAQSSKTIYSTTIDELKEIEKNYNEKENIKYVIREETNEKLVLERTLNTNCPNHFLIVLEDSKVNIYNILTNEIKSYYKTVDISEEIIREELVLELKKGIVANSKEELNLIIEDIES